MKKKFSIHDLARELNVSATTISFVLNNKGGEKKISESVRKKILDYVHEIGYRPSQIARSLRTGQSHIIGMLVEDISDPFFSGIARTVEKIAARSGYKLFLSSTENDTAQTLHLLNLMEQRRVDGYIIAPPPGIESSIRELMQEKVPLVLFDRYFPELETHVVEVDNFGGVYKAATYLAGGAYRSIAFITLHSGQTQMAARLKGYLAAVDEAGMEPTLLQVAYGTAMADTQAQIKTFLHSNSHTDAIIFATNYLAINGLKAVRDLGLAIPDDIAVISFDDNTHFNLFSPSITAVAQPIEEIAEEVVQQLLDALSDERASKKRKMVTLPVKIIVRNSSFPKVKKKIVHSEPSTMKNT